MHHCALGISYIQIVIIPEAFFLGRDLFRGGGGRDIQLTWVSPQLEDKCHVSYVFYAISMNLIIVLNIVSAV